MNIWMLVYNNFTTDQRVLKEAATLNQGGHRVTVVAVLDKTTAPHELRDEIRILRIDRRPLHYRLLWALRSIRRLIRLPASAALDRLGLSERVAALRGDPPPVAALSAGERPESTTASANAMLPRLFHAVATRTGRSAGPATGR